MSFRDTSGKGAPFNSLTRVVASFIFVLLISMVQGQAVIVNEIMASNDQTISDTDGNEHDWIELFNPGSVAISLVGYWLSDDSEEPMKHQLTGPESDLTIAPGGYLLLWASGDPSAGPRHLGFSLSADGEDVSIHTPDGSTQLDWAAFDEQTTDVSYGRSSDGSGPWMFFDQPTPGAPNNTSTGYVGFLSQPVFEVAPGFHASAPITRIFSAGGDVQVWYTLDGSEPSPNDVDGRTYLYKNQFSAAAGSSPGPFLEDTLHSFPYSGPIQLPDPTAAPNNLCVRNTVIGTPFHTPDTHVRKGIVLRAKAFKSGFIPSKTTTGTYFVTPGGTSPYTLPVLNVTSTPENLFGYEQGLLTAGADYDAWRVQNPSSTVNFATPANWHRDSEHPLHVEFIPENGVSPDFAVNAGFQMHGTSSVALPRKGMRVYFRGVYGTKALEYPMFNEQAYSDHKTWVIRQSGGDQDHTNLRDWTHQTMCATIGSDTQAARAVVLFINGEFWGVHQLIERYDDDYLVRHYGLEKGSIDLLTRNSEVNEGDAVHYTDLMNYVQGTVMTSEAAYNEVATRMDIANYIDHYSAQIFIGNADWPKNNIKFFRKRVPYTPDAPPGHDGRWRWLMYDTDYGFQLGNNYPPSLNFLDLVLTAAPNNTGARIFRKLMLNQRFKHEWINRHADLLNTAFAPAIVGQVIQTNRALIQHDMMEHFPRWRGDPGSLANWNQRLSVMTSYAVVRRGFARQEVITSLAVPAMHELTVDVSSPQHGYVRINSIDLLPTTYGVAADPYPWNGTYYETVPVTLTAHALPGFAFSHWEGAVSSSSPTIVHDPAGPDTLIAVFVPGVVCPEVQIHTWHFNDLGSGTVVDVQPDASLVPGARITYPGTGDGYMDATPDSEGTLLNGEEGTPAGRALRVRNPSDTRQLMITAPATGYRDVELSFATTRTSAGATEQLVEWTVDPAAEQWSPLAPTYPVGQQFEVRSFSLQGSTAAYDNPHLTFRITFQGPAASGSSGNDRFDNIAIHGKPLQVHEAMICQGEPVAFHGSEYDQPGDHLVEVPGILDCGHQVMLRIRETQLDTTVTASWDGLSAPFAQGTIQWLDCNNGLAPIPGATESDFHPEANGSYAVSMVHQQCAATSGCHAFLSVGVPVRAEEDGPAMFPIPARELATLHAGTTPIGTPYVLLDLTGATVATGMITGPRTDIPLSGLAQGTYVLHLHSTSRHVLRLIKI